MADGTRHVYAGVRAALVEQVGGWPEVERLAWLVDELADEHDVIAADPHATTLAVRLAAERHVGALIALSYVMAGGGCHRCAPWGGMGFVPELRHGSSVLLDLCPRCGGEL